MINKGSDSCGIFPEYRALLRCADGQIKVTGQTQSKENQAGHARPSAMFCGYNQKQGQKKHRDQMITQTQTKPEKSKECPAYGSIQMVSVQSQDDQTHENQVKSIDLSDGGLLPDKHLQRI